MEAGGLTFVLLMLSMGDQPAGTQARPDGETNDNGHDEAR